MVPDSSGQGKENRDYQRRKGKRSLWRQCFRWGVINIITKEGERFKTGVEDSGGSYDTYKGNAYASGTSKNLSYALAGSYLTSNGYRDNSAQESKDFGLNLKYE